MKTKLPVVLLAVTRGPGWYLIFIYLNINISTIITIAEAYISMEFSLEHNFENARNFLKYIWNMDSTSDYESP